MSGEYEMTMQMLRDRVGIQNDDIKRLRARVKGLEEALGFYANHNNWERRIEPETAPYSVPSTVSNDAGSVARTSLGWGEPKSEVPFG